MNHHPLHRRSQPGIGPQPRLDLDLPLHPETDSGEHVAELVGTLLDGVASTRGRHRISDRDIVQALTIVTAIRAAVAEVSGRSGEAIELDLHSVECEERLLN